MTDETYRKFLPIVQGLARKCAKQVYERDVDDIEQELWVAVIKRNNQDEEPIDVRLAYRICYDKIKDMMDYDQRRSHLSLEDLIQPETSSINYISVEQVPIEDQVILNSIFDEFPEGSKERLFLEYWGQFARINDFGIDVSKTRTKDGYTESQLAVLLGFEGTHDKKFTKFRKKMRQFVLKYYGLD